MGPRHEQDVALEDRPLVQEPHEVGILEDPVGRDLPGRDPAEDAVGRHSQTPPHSAGMTAYRPLPARASKCCVSPSP